MQHSVTVLETQENKLVVQNKNYGPLISGPNVIIVVKVTECSEGPTE